MNFFDLHIGDYEAATAHLSMLEDACYCRMLRIYYRTEKPLPADLKQVQRLVRAVSKAERDAVQQVLADFFELRDDGWHQHRCDAEIGRYVDGEPEREVKKANEDNRLRKHRLERAELFRKLTDAGHHAAWNMPMADLRELVKRVSVPKSETAEPPLPATAPATPATATHYPLPTTQYPVGKSKALPAEAGGRRFPEFWQAWPSTDRKQDRKKCLAKWVRCGWDTEADSILAHVAAMKATKKWLDGYEPAPLTYLNGERWKDGVEPAERAGSAVFEGAV